MSSGKGSHFVSAPMWYSVTLNFWNELYSTSIALDTATPILQPHESLFWELSKHNEAFMAPAHCRPADMKEMLGRTYFRNYVWTFEE